MKMRLAKTFRKQPQCLFHADNIGFAEAFDRGKKARAKEDGWFSHALVFQ